MEENVIFELEGKVDLPLFFSKDKIYAWFELIAEHYQVEIGELNFIFCDDTTILDVNRKYLNHDYFTDVITFDYKVANILNGDIYISLDTVLSNSALFSVSYEEEFHRIICHSLLHLIGFKDKSEEDSIVMTTNENKCLELLTTLV